MQIFGKQRILENNKKAEKVMRFDSYHPMINFIYFTGAILCTVCFQHPVFLLISFGSAFVYSVKLGGWRNFCLNLLLVLLAAIYGGWYSYYHHFGVTNLGENFIGNQITLEAVVYGWVRGIQIITVLMWFFCIFTLITADKIVYLFGCISPKLSLFLSILLRSVPRIKKQAKKIEIFRAGIGRGIHQGTLWRRFRNLLALLSILITWTIENFMESSDSMKSRGYTLKGRTAFSIYRFDHRDRALVVSFSVCLTMVMMAVLFYDTRVSYDPVICWNPITWRSWLFYGAYGVFLLLPMGLQIFGEITFSRLQTAKAGK